jgi:hypothetical protein
LFVVCGGANVDEAPWRSLGIPDFGAVGGYERALRDAVSHREEFGRLMLDGAVVSLIPEAAGLNEWTWQWAMDRLPNPNVVIYMQGARDGAEVMEIMKASSLTHRCKMAGTPFVVASRAGTSFCR